jgi:hypothetical protein
METAAEGFMLTPPQSDVAGVVEAMEPFVREINRLEREYGFDRPMDQYQPLMITLADCISLRIAARQMILAASQRTTGDEG